MAVEMENLKLDSQFYACHSREYVIHSFERWL